MTKRNNISISFHNLYTFQQRNMNKNRHMYSKVTSFWSSVSKYVVNVNTTVTRLFVYNGMGNPGVK